VHLIRATWRQWGATLTLLYAVHRALQHLSSGRSGLICYGLYAQPIGAGQFAAVRDEPKTLVERAGPNSACVASFPRPQPVIAQRFATGADCHVAIVNGAFAGYIWISRATFEEDEVRCSYKLPDGGDAVWDFDVYVEPSRRMGRTMARLWKAVDAELTREGVRWSFSRISIFNRASVAAHKHLGATRVGTAAFLCLGPLQIALFNNAPFIHLSINRQTRGPILQLRSPSRTWKADD
jgi:hypothetical protein